MNLRKFLGNKGQTAVEYILMLSVSVSMGVAFFKKFEKYLLSNPDSYVNTYIGRNGIYTRLFKSDPDFKRYRLPR